MANFSDPGNQRASRGGKNRYKENGKTARRNWRAGTERYDDCACGRPKHHNEYICPYCSNLSYSYLNQAPALTAGKAQVKTKGCRRCEYLSRCRDRVIANLWVLCEIPDEVDVKMAYEEAI